MTGNVGFRFLILVSSRWRHRESLGGWIDFQGDQDSKGMRGMAKSSVGGTLVGAISTPFPDSVSMENLPSYL